MDLRLIVLLIGIHHQKCGRKDYKMSKWNRIAHVIITVVVVTIVSIIAVMMWYDASSGKVGTQELLVYRVSDKTWRGNEVEDGEMTLYKDFIKSQKKVQVQPYSSRTQYFIDFRKPVDSFEVSAFISGEQKWKNVDVADLGNYQYSVYAKDFNSYTTLTYCITTMQEGKMEKYYWTVKKE